MERPCHTPLPKLGAAHLQECPRFANNIYIFTLATSHMVLQTHPRSLGCHALRVHEPADPNYQRTSASPYLREPWRGINHRSLAIYPPSKPHTHSKHYCPKESLRPPLLKGQALLLSYTPKPSWKQSGLTLAPRSTFYTCEAEPLPVLHPTPHPQAQVPTLQTGGLHGPNKGLESGKPRSCRRLRSRASPGSACPGRSRRGPGANVSMQSYIATRRRKLGAGNTENPRPIPPPPPAAPLLEGEGS